MRLGTAAMMAACVLAGCARGEGLLIEVVVASDDSGLEIGAIDLWVGEEGPIDPARFIRLEGPADAQAVGAWPFEILIVPDDGPRTIWAGAFGYGDLQSIGGAPIAMGALDTPVDVVPGELRYARITLHAYRAPDADCLFEDGLAIGPADGSIEGLDCDDDQDPEDCDDLDANSNHGEAERCDGVDNNCDGICDEGFDADGDNHSRCGAAGCEPACLDGAAPAPGLLGSCDCDDANVSAFPGGEELNVCDGVDSDCDPATNGEAQGPVDVPGNHVDDECNGVCDVDEDGDLIATGVEGDPLAPGSWSTSCQPVIADCNDDPAQGGEEIYPNALEQCDGIDNDCELPTTVLDGPCFALDQNGGHCTIGTRLCAEELLGTWEPACAPGAVRVADAVCDAWAAFAEAPWPERAMYDAVTDDERNTCRLNVWRAPSGSGPINEVCTANPRARIEGGLGGSSDCTSILVGGGQRGGWQLALRTRNLTTNVTGDMVPSCDIDLVVTGVSGEGQSNVRLPATWALILQQKGGDGGDPETVGIPVELRPAYADETSAFACPAGPSLDCD